MKKNFYIRSKISIILVVLSVSLAACSNEKSDQATVLTNQLNSSQAESTHHPKESKEVLQKEQSLPNINYFAKNKSDRFFIDFEDIIAGHPYVGARSPRPHNDAQVYFSNTDQRWIDAKKPSDYPPIYAVADGYVALPQSSFYNVVDHSNADPPWWHVAYNFTLRIAKDGNSYIEFLYQMEPYMIPDITDKPKDFYKQFILVTDGQYVKKGDVLALSLIHI